MAAELAPEQLFPRYKGWLEAYRKAKDECAFAEAIAWLKTHPEAANNRNTNLRGLTLLHQAAFWGVDKGIIQSLRDLGADPSLRCYEKERTPEEMALANENPGFVEALKEVYGGDYAAVREKLCMAAKDGNFPKVIQILVVRPHLSGLQTEGGWSLLHHAAFHKAGQLLFRRLRSLGCSAALRTHLGESCEDVLRRYHGDNSFSEKAFKEVYRDACAAVDTEAAAQEEGAVQGLVVGARASFYSTNAGVICGTVTAVTEEEASMSEAGGAVLRGPRWRFRALAAAKEGGEEEEDEEASTERCCVCNEETVGRKVSAQCVGSEHFLCTECTVTALGAACTSGSLPLSCGLCAGAIDVGSYLGRRPLSMAWAEAHPGGGSFQDFAARISRKRKLKWEMLQLEEKADCERMVEEGEMMRCLNPGCREPLEDLGGKGWAQCYFCRTEHCWQTKRLRRDQFGQKGCGGTHACH